MRWKSPDETFYEIVKRNTRTNQDLQVLPKAVKGKLVAQATVERLQQALEKSSSTQRDVNVKWVFRISTR